MGITLEKRKLIGVIISEAEALYQSKLLKGIIEECYALDYDVAIFSTLIKDTGLPEYKCGEKNIYNLMNFDMFAGIIVAGITFALHNLFEEIEAMLLEKCTCPVVFVDRKSEHFPFVYTHDEEPTERMTDHLIEFHGYKDIYCLAGGKDVISTVSRVQGIKNSIVKHGIHWDESRVSYEGNFDFASGEVLARKIAQGEIKKPDAVFCISDYMAIGMVNELTKQGLRVPEDIAVVGYDGSDEAATHHITITTYTPPIKQSGMDAVCVLSELITGDHPESCRVSCGFMEIGRSCGCHDFERVKRRGITRIKDKSDAYTELLESYMVESLTAEVDFEECINKFCYYLYLIKEYSDYYLCLCDNWDGSANSYSPEKHKTLTVGYTPRMKMVLACEGRKFVYSNSFFSTKEMIPDLWRDREKPKAYYFTPIHFNDNCLGYSVLSYGDNIKSFDIIYRNWSRNIMNALEFNRTHRKLYISSFRDVLTGIYNRSGMEQNVAALIESVSDQEVNIFVIMADLDNLKSVNDRYGHKEGDNIISVVANVMQSCSKRSDICARIGGDEFLIVGIDDNDEVKSYLSEVKQSIAEYNMVSKKPYRIEISMGYYTDRVNSYSDIDHMIEKADKNMYMNKVRHKRRLSQLL